MKKIFVSFNSFIKIKDFIIVYFPNEVSFLFLLYFLLNYDFFSLLSNIFPYIWDFLTFLLIILINIIDLFFYLIPFKLKYFLKNILW